MPTGLTLNVRVNSDLASHVARQLGECGEYDNASEYVRDLIRQDKRRADAERFERLRAELQHAFAQPDSDYVAITADEVIARNRLAAAA